MNRHPVRAVKRKLHRLLFRLRSAGGRPVLITDRNGNRLRLDDRDSLGLYGRRVHEPEVTALMRRVIEPGHVVLDIGANIGYFTLLCARRTGSEGRVFAFEPASANFAILRENVERAGLTQVTLVNRAVSDAAGALPLYLSETNRGMNRTYPSRCAARAVEVEAVRLDDFLPPLTGRVDFVKIDIEGWEYPALRGLAGTIGRNRGIRIVTEFAPTSMIEAGIDPEAYLDFLLDQGLVPHRLDGRDPIPLDEREVRRWIVELKEVAARFLDRLASGHPGYPPERIGDAFRRFARNECGFAGPLSEDFFCRCPS